MNERHPNAYSRPQVSTGGHGFGGHGVTEKSQKEGSNSLGAKVTGGPHWTTGRVKVSRCAECWKRVVLDYAEDLQLFGQEAALERRFAAESIHGFLRRLNVIHESFIRVFRYMRTQWRSTLSESEKAGIHAVQQTAYRFHIEVKTILVSGEKPERPRSLSTANCRELAADFWKLEQIVPDGLPIERRFRSVAELARIVSGDLVTGVDTQIS